MCALVDDVDGREGSARSRRATDCEESNRSFSIKYTRKHRKSIKYNSEGKRARSSMCGRKSIEFESVLNEPLALVAIPVNKIHRMEGAMISR
jgi:hypothetical protein